MSFGDTYRITVVDDEPFMLKLLSKILADLGYGSVMTYGSARAALVDIQGAESLPDLVLLDLNMPDMDGVEFTRELRKRRYQGGIILVSGEEEQVLQSVETLLRTQRANVFGMLAKPVNPDALAALIEAGQVQATERTRRMLKVYQATALRTALEAVELVNYYQPKVCVATGALVGVEALVRWNHPKDGLVMPDQFIQMAEDQGLIGRLTEIVLTNAVSQLAAWRRIGLSVRMAVNVSMDNLSQLNFPDAVTQVCERFSMPHDRLTLEITEGRLIANLGTALDVLSRLKLRRYRVSIDDFGTGYSSFVQLRNLPVDELKIDRGFVHGAAGNRKLRAIYEASLTLARQLGIQAVAEGVEDRKDWEFLRSSGCDLAQGYFIAKPMPADKLAPWAEAWKARVTGELGLPG